MGLLEAQAGLAGKFAIVVGGAAGIGRAVTLALARAGIGIASCDIDAEACRTIVKEVEAIGQPILSMQADVCDAAALDRFYDRVEQEVARADILVNVAGGVKRAPFFETTREQNAADIRRNFGYVVDSIRRAVPLIRKGGRGGSIINFTTIEAHRGAATFSVYAGAKAATANFSRAMAVELAAEGIRINMIAPDTTPSRGSTNSMSPEMLAKLAAMPEKAMELLLGMYIPQKRSPTEEDLTNALLFLVSDLSRATTGTTVHVDGGTMASSGFIDWPFGEGYCPAPMPETVNLLYKAAAEPPPVACCRSGRMSQSAEHGKL